MAFPLSTNPVVASNPEAFVSEYNEWLELVASTMPEEDEPVNWFVSPEEYSRCIECGEETGGAMWCAACRS